MGYLVKEKQFWRPKLNMVHELIGNLLLTKGQGLFMLPMAL